MGPSVALVAVGAREATLADLQEEQEQEKEPELVDA